MPPTGCGETIYLRRCQEYGDFSVGAEAMNFDEYRRDGEQLYEDFAKLIREILAAAVAKDTRCPRIQAYQSRSKGVSSLKRKLQDRRLLDAPDIESAIKDLAGARVILYTNLDVDAFLQRRIIPEIFKIHWDEVKAHHPTDENERRKYEAFHYLVSLPEELAARDEYVKFRGLRCEIQIQTLLNHAWGESSHDIIYKGADMPGFGSKTVDALRARLNKTMDDYLKPAGYELDKVQADYDRLMQGKDLFNRGELEALTQCNDNNERMARLKAIAENLIPNFDDIGSVYSEILRTLLSVAVAARTTETRPFVVDGMEFHGLSGKHVVEQVIDIIADLRYVDIEGTFQTLVELYRGETDRDVRKKIIDVVQKLASYNFDAWRQVGPYVQAVLAELLAKRSDEEILAIRPIAITVWNELLGTELDSATWAADSVTITKGAIPPGDDIKAIRTQAIDGLFMIFDATDAAGDHRSIVTSFWRVTQLPHQAAYSSDLLATALANMKTIAERLRSRIANMSFDLQEHIEGHMFREYERFRPIAEAEDDNKGCKAIAQTLIAEITALRKTMNRNREFVRFKTLIGFESVFSEQWNGNTDDLEQIDAHRRACAAKYVVSISTKNEKYWLTFIAQCAATKSDDMATFPIFCHFLQMLGRQKPEVALRLLRDGDENVLNFLPAILSGLAASDETNEYLASVDRYVEAGQKLGAVARHYRFVDAVTVEALQALMAAAIRADDAIAEIECLILAVSKWPKLGDVVIDVLFFPALGHLTPKRDCRWVQGAWFLPEARDFFAHLSAEQLGKVLDNLVYAKRINHDCEHILALIGRTQPALVWRFFADRLRRDRDDDPGYEPIPYQLFELNNVLNADPDAAVDELRDWYRSGDTMFPFTGGRLFHAVFPSFTQGLGLAFIRVAGRGDDDDIEFVLHALHNYTGEKTLHPVARAIVANLPNDDNRLDRIESVLSKTGVVSGEFGLVEALRECKALLTAWLDDESARVKEFAQRAIRRLENRIATEQRTAEMRKERRKRDYE